MAAPTAASGRPTPLAVGVVVWLASELMFFGGLFAAYFTLRAGADAWPPPDAEIGFARPLVFTIVLVSSSLTMHGAVRAAEHGNPSLAVRWLAVTFTLGAVFVGNQALEYAELPFGIDTDAYGSIFYLMTGFHGLHVVGGLFLMAAVAGVVGGRTSRAPTGPIVDVCAYYWHFVDVVWVALFATIYLVK